VLHLVAGIFHARRLNDLLRETMRHPIRRQHTKCDFAGRARDRRQWAVLNSKQGHTHFFLAVIEEGGTAFMNRIDEGWAAGILADSKLSLHGGRDERCELCGGPTLRREAVKHSSPGSRKWNGLVQVVTHDAASDNVTHSLHNNMTLSILLRLAEAAKALGVTSKSIAVSYGGRVVEGLYHVQTVNSYHERLQSWLSRGLRGVATKDLPNYLAWMRVSEWYRGDLKPEHFVISGLGRQLINT
jgi:hypothetical protein